MEKQAGRIELIFGPMFSGKSTSLVLRIRRLIVAQKRCVLLKYKNDTRYDENQVATHDRTLMEAIPCATIAEVWDRLQDFDIIGVDEGQFFPDLVQMAERLADDGKTVIIAALDATFQRKPFGKILELIPLAEKLTKLEAVCDVCKGDASFTARISESTQIELIGGSETYQAMCRKCYDTYN